MCFNLILQQIRHALNLKYGSTAIQCGQLSGGGILMWMMLIHLHDDKKNDDDVRGLRFGLNFHLFLYIMLFMSCEGLITRF